MIQSLRLFYKRTLNSFAKRCGAGIFIGIICYLIAGLANDSTIGVSIIYWTLLGIGFACNNIIQNHIEPEEIETILEDKMEDVEIYV